MKLPTITSLVDFSSDGKGTLTFHFKSADGRAHYVPIRAPVLNALAPIFLNVMSGDEAGGDVQPVTLTRVQPALTADGTPLLEMHLDHVGVRVALVGSAIEALREALQICEQGAAEHAKAGTRH